VAEKKIRPERTMEIPESDCCATVSTVPSGRMGFYRTIPDTSCLANFLCSFGAIQSRIVNLYSTEISEEPLTRHPGLDYQGFAAFCVCLNRPESARKTSNSIRLRHQIWPKIGLRITSFLPPATSPATAKTRKVPAQHLQVPPKQ
jgi:hypothetical protein